MSRIIAIMCIVIATISCKPQSSNYNKITIDSKDSVKNVTVEITHTDTIIFEVPSLMPDSLILASVKQATDSLRKDSIRKDSLHQINFKRITKIINGGYNGHAEREKIWNNAKQILYEKENNK